MKLTTIRELYRDTEAYLDKEITVGGWVRSVRDSKSFGFLVLHDGSFFETLQIVYHDTMENFAQVSRLNVGAAVIVKGTLVATPQAKQPFEIQAAEVTLEGASAPEYPLQKKRHTLEYQDEYVSGGVPGPFPDCLRDSSVLSGAGLCLCAYAADHRQ